LKGLHPAAGSAFGHGFDMISVPPLRTLASSASWLERLPHMNAFRLIHWVELPQQFHELRFRRAMSAMSAAPVDGHQLSMQCGLSRRELQSFLLALTSAGAIAVCPARRGRRMQTGSQHRPGLLPRLWRWLMCEMPTNLGDRS
jgi:hypothetical protein